jgi:hypothetical protein
VVDVVVNFVADDVIGNDVWYGVNWDVGVIILIVSERVVVVGISDG